MQKNKSKNTRKRFKKHAYSPAYSWYTNVVSWYTDVVSWYTNVVAPAPIGSFSIANRYTDDAKNMLLQQIEDVQTETRDEVARLSEETKAVRIKQCAVLMYDQASICSAPFCFMPASFEM